MDIWFTFCITVLYLYIDLFSTSEYSVSLKCTVLQSCWHAYYETILKLHLAYVLRWNRGKNIYFFSHIKWPWVKMQTFRLLQNLNKQASELFICKSNTELKCDLTD